MNLIATQDLDIDVGKNATVHAPTAGCLDLCTVDLIKNAGLALTRATTLAQVNTAGNIANYTGYAQGVVVWGPATIADDGEIEYLGTTTQFRPTDGVVPNQIYGVAVKNAGGTKLYFAGYLDGKPLPMNSALDAIDVTIRYRPSSNSLTVVIS